MSSQIESQDNKSQATMDYNFQDIEGERYICINALETIPTFFVSMISAHDHWFFIATNGALSAGRGLQEILFSLIIRLIRSLIIPIAQALRH